MELELQQTSVLIIALQRGEWGGKSGKLDFTSSAFYNVDTIFSFRMTTVHQGQVGQ